MAKDLVAVSPQIPLPDTGEAVAKARVRARLHWRNWPVRLKLQALLVLLGLLPAFVTAQVVIRQSDQVVLATRAAATAGYVQSAAGLVTGYVQNEVRVVSGIASSNPALLLVAPPGRAGDRQVQRGRMAPLFDLALSTAPALRSGTLYLMSPGARVLASTRPALLGNAIPATVAAQEAIASRAAAVTIEQARGTNLEAVVVAAPILRDGILAGVAVGEFDARGLLDALALAHGSLVLADNRTIAAAVPAGPPIQILGTPLTAPASAQEPPVVQAVQAGLTELPDGMRAVALGPNALVIAPAGTAESVLDSGAIRLTLLLLALIVAGLAVYVASVITRPILVLVRSMRAVRTGNYAARAGLRQCDELGEIATTVDMLIARTQRLVADVENQRAELENGIITLFTELADAAGGDLTVRPTMSEGSLGAVADSVGILLERFSATVKHIQLTASAVSNGTSQVASTVLRVSHEAQKQASQLATGAEAIVEMAQSAQSVSQRTRAATDVAAQAVTAVESGHSAVSYAREAVRRTGETSKKAARQVKSLGESAQLMGNALILVQRNTEELHLIAGNASIEAARYADNGGVFRTVADSIEQLAQQSQVALRQIQTVVENTQRETARVVAAIEDVAAEVATMHRVVNLAGENFDTINVVVQRLADLNIFIASASEQQALQAADVAETIGALNQISLQTSMNTAASAEAAVRLRQLTEQLNDSVSTLKVS